MTAPATASATAPPLLDVAGLRVTYGGVVAVSDVDLRVAEGAVYGLIGPNGAGKTSMVDALTGYTRPAAPGWSCSTSPRPGSTPTRAASSASGCGPCRPSTA